MSTTTDRLPVVFVPHGGGPWPFIEGFGDPQENAQLASYLRGIRAITGAPPAALLVISAHWEAPVATVSTSPQPPMLYDYSGFPAHTYQLQWPAPGDPALAARVRGLLDAAGVANAADGERGYDHGTFVPMMLTYPDAAIPAIQLSLVRGLDPAAHLAIGRALAPLRDEGVFIIGSGMSFHNMRGFGDPRAVGPAEAFDAWLRDTVEAEPAERDRRLAEWATAPSAREAHPREEHLVPLMVIAGAAGADRGTTAFNGRVLGVAVSGFQFGASPA